MNNHTQTNSWLGGMNMDVDYSVLKENQYIYAENVRIVTNDDGTFGVMQGIEGLAIVNQELRIPANEKIIHTDVIRKYGVVFTEDNNGLNHIYRFDFTLDPLNPVITKILSAKLDINYPVSSVCRWESDNYVKVYWADGVHQIRVLNIAPIMDDYNKDINVEELNIVPAGVLPAMEFKGYGGGALKAGKVQYAYQLFNVRGSETGISPLTGMIRLTRNDIGNASVIGTEKDGNSGKSVNLYAKIPGTTFTYARIISIHYPENTTVPNITVVDEVALVGDELSYSDSGGNKLTELTIDEFNAIASYTFYPKVLETKDNILFAANIKEDTWDVEYDARAYRCDINGKVELRTATGATKTFNINELAEDTVPKEHDCITVTNTGYNNNYLFNKNYVNRVMGGTGLNVSYKFVTTDLVEDGNIVVDGKHPAVREMNPTSASIKSLNLYEVSNSKATSGVIEFTSDRRKVLNYSDPEIELKVLGYQRDEVYRFGIVFYNEKNMSSSVHWIGDIRFPNSAYSQFYEGDGSVKLTTGITHSNLGMVTKPIGLQFTVKNIPDGVTGFEIVRCNRTAMDRRIIAQGLVSYVARVESARKLQSNTSRPYPFVTFCDPKYVAYNTHDSINDYESYDTHFFDDVPLESTGNFKTTLENVFAFISPEVAFNRAAIQDHIAAIEKITRVGSLYSVIESDDDRNRTFINISANPYNANDGKITRMWVDEKNVFVDFVELRNNSDYGDRQYTGPSETLAKYYSHTPEVNKIEYSSGVLDVKYADSLDWNVAAEELPLSESISIAGSPYSNSIGTWINEDKWADEYKGKYREGTKKGVAGPMLLLRSDDMGRNAYGGYKVMSVDWELTSPYIAHRSTGTVLCNLIQPSALYGGGSYASRTNSVYIGTGSYTLVDSKKEYTTNVFGGDTYLGLCDYAYSTKYWHEDDLTNAHWRKHVHSIYFPCESSMNQYMRLDDFQMSRNYKPDMQNNIAVVANIYAQDMPMYAYNDAYSAKPNAKLFVTKGRFDIDNLHSDSRIISSEPKTNNEIADSWTKFKVANYIDVDNQHGSVNNLMTFRNNLFFWQDNAFGTVAVNERSLISDNNMGSLTLGTGGILTHFDYITVKNGSMKDKLRVNTASDSSVYWYDETRDELCGFDGSLQTVSKLKGVQSFLNKKADFNNDQISVYDKKYNEVLFTLDNKTLAFNEQLGVFTSFYTIDPDRYFEFADGLYAFRERDLRKYNGGDEKPLFSNGVKWSKFDFVVNGDYPQTKTFDNVEYGADVEHGTNLTNIVFNTKRQESFTTLWNQIDYREDTYKFVIPRSNRDLTLLENTINMSYRDRMKGKYLISHYEYDCNNGKQFKLPYITTMYRYSMI